MAGRYADRLIAAASTTSALQLGYRDLLRAMTPDLLRPCLLRLLEGVFDVLVSYHVMAQWHALAVQKQSQMAAAAQGGLNGWAGQSSASLRAVLACWPNPQDMW